MKIAGGSPSMVETLTNLQADPAGMDVALEAALKTLFQ